MSETETGTDVGSEDPVVVTPMMRVARSRHIAEMRSRKPKVPWSRVAKTTGLSVRTCQRLLKDLEAFGDTETQRSPADWVTERLDGIRVTMDEASATYAAAPPGSAVRVGALKLFNECSFEMFEIATRAGWVPRHLGALNAEREMQAMFREFAELARKHGATDEFLAGILRLAEARITAGPVVEGRALTA